MTKSNGIASLKQAAKLLNKHSPDGESLAYINPEEAKLLKAHGGSGIMTAAGVPSYVWDWLKPFVEPAKKFITDFASDKIGDWLGGGNPPPGEKGGPAYTGSSSGIPPGQPGGPGWVTPPYFPPAYDDYNYPGIGTPNQPISKGPMGDEMWDKSKNPFWQDIGGSIFQSGKEFLKGRYGGAEGIKNIGKDAMSVWMALKAKKDQEGLNNAEMEQFNKLNQRMEAAQTQFTENIAGGGVENIPTDVSRFTEVDLPDMITTAAEGGRIGYGFGSKTGTARADPNRVVTGDPRENLLSYFSNKYSGKEQTQPLEDGQAMSGDNFMANMISQSPQSSQFQLLQEYQNYVTEVGEENAVPFGEWQASRMTAAQGGRIGAFNGGIQGLMPQQGFMPQPGLDPRMGYALGSPDVQEEIITDDTQTARITDKQMQQIDHDWRFLEAGALELDDLWKNAKGWDDTGSTGFWGMGQREAEPMTLKEFKEEMLKRGYLNLPGSHKSLTDFNKLKVAQGGRIGAQGGGIMPLLDMGGMEKDYRQDGGFVPIGRKEKADDVPARLSKNEFVFTADAVKAAGGGDIDEGAQRMYNVMKNLEAGGEISEQSQGHG